MSRRYNKYGAAFAEVSQRAQAASAPLFIPTFTGLRRTIVEHLTESLHRIEQELSTNESGSEERVVEAVTLLRHMGRSWEHKIVQHTIISN
jgi:hypothetical protein